MPASRARSRWCRRSASGSTGPLALSGAIANGGAVLAAQAMGADFAYIGSAFIATDEARAADAYKRCIVECSSDDIVYSSLFTGVHGNYLKPSIRAAGLDPDSLPESDPSADEFRRRRRREARPGRTSGAAARASPPCKAVVPAAGLIARLAREYAARSRAGALASGRLRPSASSDRAQRRRESAMPRSGPSVPRRQLEAGR